MIMIMVGGAEAVMTEGLNLQNVPPITQPPPQIPLSGVIKLPLLQIVILS